MVIDHIAVAVDSVEAAAEKLCVLLGYSRKTSSVNNSRQKVNVLFLGKEGSLDIKLIEPSQADSPLWAFVRKGGGVHHVCFRAPDVVAAVEDLVAKGARMLSPPAPGEAFEDNLIAFCYVGLGLNIEIVDTKERRALATQHCDLPNQVGLPRGHRRLEP